MANVPERPFPLSWWTERTKKDMFDGLAKPPVTRESLRGSSKERSATLLMSILYLFDGSLLQMFLHRLLDEKLLLLDLHPRVLFPDVLQQRLVRNATPVVARLQRQRTKKSDAFSPSSRRESTCCRGRRLRALRTIMASMRISSTLC